MANMSKIVDVIIADANNLKKKKGGQKNYAGLETVCKNRIL